MGLSPYFVSEYEQGSEAAARLFRYRAPVQFNPPGPTISKWTTGNLFDNASNLLEIKFIEVIYPSLALKCLNTFKKDASSVS